MRKYTAYRSPSWVPALTVSVLGEGSHTKSTTNKTINTLILTSLLEDLAASHPFLRQHRRSRVLFQRPGVELFRAPPAGLSKLNLSGFHLVRNMLCFPLVLQGIYHYWTYYLLSIFSGGLEQTEEW